MSFGEVLKELRDSRGMSQDDLAEKLGISRNSIMNYETDNEKQKTLPKYNILLQIADIFNVTTDYLLGRPGAQKHFTVEADDSSKPYISDIVNLIKSGNLPEGDLQHLTRFTEFVVKDHIAKYNAGK